ncbi:amino acid adenylation domain-containing protein [Dactylosporangium roseum]|uniref:Amino acid adenylation domain-containing protein n=1 Tax=Dactylosporangium roseum TaxID=47989 RepID=A0ABY5Z580_9ACTN|nr:amino acid adenylation domain-containing protein [Dactylosporangium roseum]UWZ36208.1 amino acid adenylation domain-containing protein [Dactylosporangium roseum]
MLTELLDAAADRFGDLPALRDTEGVVRSHGALRAETVRLAQALAALGAGPGKPVAILGDHLPGSIAAIIAVVRCGAFYVPLDGRWPVSRAVAVIESLAVETLIVAEEFTRTGFELAYEVPAIRHVLVTGSAQRTGEAAVDPEIARTWESITAFADPLEAAGFNLDRDGFRYDARQVGDYATHVRGLVMDHYRAGDAVVEIGTGSGLIARELAPRVSRLLASDPAAGAMSRLEAYSRDRGLPVSTVAAYAHEMTPHIAAMDDVGVVLLSSVVQYFPGPDYLRGVLHDLLTALRPGATLVIADLVEPSSGQFPGSLRLPRRWWEALRQQYPGLDVRVCPRDGTALDSPLRHRYDVLITVPETVAAQRPSPPLGSGERPLRSTDLSGGESVALPRPDAGDLAYVITTSGSTGEPKLVAVTHRSVVNLVRWFNRRHEVTPDDVVLQMAALTFDLSVYDIFGVLAAGGSILLQPSARLAEPESVVDTLLDHGVTLWNSAPAAFTALLPFLRRRPPAGRDRMRRVFLSGDWVPLSTHASVAREFPRATLVALGGATEACVWSNDFVVSGIEPHWASIPYGHPMDNARYYVLREDGSPCEVGEPGELHIAGTCVAAGYLNDAELTRQRFLPDPWWSGPDARMYRTGDRAKWTADGWVEFLGRLDRQVKIHGYRIELGEIEQAARELPGVHEAFAMTYGDPKEPDLGMVVRAEASLSEGTLRGHLRAHLPQYAVPSLVRVVDTLPVAGTGKVDRAALTGLLTATPRVEAGEEAAEDDEAVARMTGLWSEVFGRRLGARDDFFASGGTSLLAGRLAARLSDVYDVHLPVAAVYEAGTPRALAARIGHVTDTEPLALAAQPISGHDDDPAPLALQQEVIWYIEQMDPGTVGYNCIARVDIRGPLDRARFREALTAVTARHPALRTRYLANADGALEQWVRDESEVSFEFVEASSGVDEIVRQAGRHVFDLEREPLIRWTLIRRGEDDHVLAQVEHHFPHDGWSLWMVLHGISKAYTSLGAGRTPDLGSDRTSYADYCRWQAEWVRGPQAKQQIDHWLDELGSVDEPLRWPFESRREPRFPYRGDTHELVLPADLQHRVDTFAQRAGATPFAVLKAAYVALIGHVCDAPSPIIGGALRNRRLAGVERTVGMFVNTCAWGFPGWRSSTFERLCREVTHRLAAGMDNQEIPFALVASRLRTPYDRSRNPVFQTSFSMNDWPDTTLDLGDGIEASVSFPSNGAAKFDIDIIVIPEPDGTRMLWRYSEPLFTTEDARALAEQYLDLLDRAMAAPDVALGPLANGSRHG